MANDNPYHHNFDAAPNSARKSTMSWSAAFGVYCSIGLCATAMLAGLTALTTVRTGSSFNLYIAAVAITGTGCSRVGGAAAAFSWTNLRSRVVGAVPATLASGLIAGLSCGLAALLVPGVVSAIGHERFGRWLGISLWLFMFVSIALPVFSVGGALLTYKESQTTRSTKPRV